MTVGELAGQWDVARSRVFQWRRSLALTEQVLLCLLNPIDNR